MEGAGYHNGSDSTHRSGPLHPDLRPPSERSERSESSRRSERDTIYDLRKQLIVARQQIQALKKRAAEQDGEMQTLVSLVKQVNEARLNALQEAARANEELRLYKLRFEDAKSEINYAQDLLRIVERQRNQAEQAALDARTEARVLNLEKRVENVFRDTRQNMEHQRRSWQQTMPDSESDRTSEASESQPYEETEGPLSAIQPQEVTPPPPVNPPPFPAPASAPPSAPPSPAPISFSPAPVPFSPQPIFAPSPRAESILVPPRSIHNASPSVQHEHIEIPPDGFIPSLDEDGGLRLPPPHELAKPPPTPERQPSPALSNAPIPIPPASIPPSPAPSSRSRRDVATPVPPISIPPSPAPSSRSRRDAPVTVPPSPALSSRSRRTQRQGSGSSVSTGISQFDLMKDPIGANTPLSAIPEVHSGSATPNQPSIYQGTPAPLSPYQPIPVYQATPAPSTIIPPPSEGGGGLSRRPSLTQSIHSARTPAGYTASIPPATHSRKDSSSNATTVLMVPAPPMVPPPNPHVTTSRPASRMSTQSHHPSLSRRQSVGSVASSRRTGAPPANASYYAGTSAPIYAQSHVSRHDADDLDELRSEPGSVATPPSESSDFDRDPLQTPAGNRRPSIYATGSQVG